MTLKLVGYVIDRAGYRPIPGATVDGLVAVQRDAATFGRANTNDGGQFTLELDADQWQKWLAADPRAFVFVRVTYGRPPQTLDTRATARWRPSSLDPLRVYVDSTIARTLKGTVTREKTPAPGLTVVARRYRPGGGGELLGTAVTDAAGAYAISYTLDWSETSSRQPLDLQLFAFASPAQTNLLGASEVLRAAAVEAELNLALPAPVDSFAAVSAALAKPLPETLVAYLTGKGLRTLTEVRATGGIGPDPDLPVDAAPAVALLNAMAALSIAGAPVPALAAFAQAGIGNISDLAMLPPPEVRTALGDRAPISAEAVLDRAAFADAILGNHVLQKRFDPTASRGDGSGFADLFVLTCACSCSAANGPQAYLAHLLRFMLQAVRYNGNRFDIGFLQTYFNQPFRDLPATCDSAEHMVAQARIAVEVLRKDLTAHGKPTDSPPWYLEAAYLELLDYLDITYDELRTVYASGSQAKKAKFIRDKGLGIGAPADAQIVDDLYRDVQAAAGSNLAITEAWLESTFALRSTLADPLAPDNDHPHAMELRRRARRVQWVKLDASPQRPLGAILIVDPDLMDELDMQVRTPNPPNDNIPTWKPIDFLVRRRKELVIAEALIAAGFTPVVGVTPGQLVKNLFLSLATTTSFIPGSAIPVPPFGFQVAGANLDYPTLLQIRNASDGGQDISGDLAKWKLSEDDVRLLVRYIEVLDANEPVTMEETDAVRRAIFAHAKRAGFWPPWLVQEATNALQGGQIALEPSLFRLRKEGDAPDPVWQPRPRLAEQDERDLWVDILESRTRETGDLVTDLADRIVTLETRLLPQLRNQLIGLTGAGSVYTRAKVDALTDHYQLDFEAGGCQRTTRVTQAIETIQGLLFGVRNGLLNDAAWSIGTSDFDTTWSWLGTYDTWRAAVGAFLYPESYLKPSLRGNPSPGFASALQTLRDGDPVGQPEAIQAYESFADYLNDVASLELLAAAPVPLTIESVQGSAAYLVGVTRGRPSTNYYWSVVIEQPDDSGDQSWWREVAAMSSVDDVLGAAVCGTAIVALTTSSVAASKTLDLWTLPLPAADSTIEEILAAGEEWQGPTSLQLPDNIDSFDSATINGGTISSAPVIVIQASETAVYSRPLALDGTGWSGKFRKAAGQPLWRRLGESDPYGITPANLATFACRGGGLSDVVAEDRFVLAADVDGDGADEIIAFASENGFWSMKLAAVGSRQRWLPMAPRSSSQTYDCALTPSFPTLFFSVAGDFDGDGITEIVAVTDARGPRSQTTSWLNLFARKWSTSAAAWTGVGSVGDLDTNAQLLYDRAWWYPVGCTVGRFTQARRDEIVITFLDQRYAGSVTDFVTFGLVDDMWSVVDTTNIAAGVPGSGGLGGGIVGSGYVAGTARQQLVLQQIGGGLLATGKFWVLEYTNGVWRQLSQLDAGALSDPTRLIVRDFDGDGVDEVAVADNSSSIRFFKYDVSAWVLEQTVALAGPVAHWAAGDFADDGSAYLIAQTTADLHAGIPAHIDQDAIPPGEQRPDLTLASNIGVRWLVAGRFAGRGSPAGIAALGDGCTFYVQSKGTRSSIVARPNIQRFKPVLRDLYAIDDSSTAAFRLLAPAAVGTASVLAQQDNRTNRPVNQAYIEEAFYFLIVEVALRLQSAGTYAVALDWLQRVARLAGTTLQPESALLASDAAGTLPELTGPAVFDPLDPHTVARHRPGSYNRFTRATFVRLLADYGDSEFSLATTESLSLARELYISALALLNAHPYAAALDACDEAIADLLADVGGVPGLASLVADLRDTLSSINDPVALNTLIAEIRKILSSNDTDAQKSAAIAALLVNQGGAGDAPTRTFGQRIAAEGELLRSAQLLAIRDINDVLASRLDDISARGGLGQGHGHGFVPLPQFSFCIPPSSSLLELKRRIELALERLRNCQDIGGNDLVVAPIGAMQPLSPATAAARAAAQQPLPYRYQTLVDRARQLLEIARQLETTMLNYIESAERKRYDAINARRDLALADAAVGLRKVQVQQSTEELGTAALQRDKAQDQVAHWQQLLRDGLSSWEVAGLAAQWSAFGLKQSAAIATAVSYAASPEGWGNDILTYGMGASVAVSNAQADALSTLAQVSNTQAEYERRSQMWAENLSESLRDVQIGNQVMLVATTRVQSAQIEQQIATLQSAYASEAASFLTSKSFANEALYEWMAGVIESVYRFFLQQATQLARLAELQLAFERQEAPQGLIKRDYWTRMRSDSSPNVNSVSTSTDSLRGLTGAANLLRDVYQLDQYAFLKNQRKQQLTETVSLARLDPLAFAQFASTGRIVFDTPMSMFDTRFPGHYVRLVHRVRLSVVALIPPNVGIRATLSNAGISRVVIPSGDGFDTVTLLRGFEQVAFTMPVDATGQFATDAQPDLLNAFEGSGVDTRWVLDLPRPANPINFDSVADVLVTFEYTALYSSVWRAAVLAALPARQPAERVFSLRFEFPDAWYDLFNAEPPAAPIEARFTVTRADFPANLERLRMTNLVLQVRFKNAVARLDIASLTFTPTGGAGIAGAAATLDDSGVVSTRRANGGAWLAIVNGAIAVEPVGEWRLRLSDAARASFATDAIDDILFSVSFEGTPPAWPAS
jgi:hypothetical protein